MTQISTPNELARLLKQIAVFEKGWGSHVSGTYTCSPQVTINGQLIRLNIYSYKKNYLWMARRVFDAVKMFSWRSKGTRTHIQHITINHTNKQYVSISGTFLSQKTGKLIGDFCRTLSYTAHGRPQSVYHSSLDIYGKHQGQGIGSRFVKTCMNRYKATGFRFVDVTAAGTNGRYVWAKLGFELKDYNRSLWYHSHHAEVLPIVERAAKKGTDPKTIEIARDMIVNGIPKNMSMRQVANLGKNGPWKNRQKQHLGKALLMEANSWSGRLKLVA